jgi:hypothetical protein
MHFVSHLIVLSCMSLGFVIGCDGADSEIDTLSDMGSVDTGMGMEPSEVMPVGCVNQGTQAATAACLSPTQSPEYYIAEALAYFDTLDVDADRESVPNYHDQVARWEWPPWLLLTGYGAADMVNTSDALRLGDPSTVPIRDCRFFEVQPFARCYIEFEYEHGPCPIYEEFTFNDAGEMTFIEAWSEQPGMLPIRSGDRWAQDPDFYRLSTRVPGLGNATGTAVIDSDYMRRAAMQDHVVADYAERATNWIVFWATYYQNVPPDFFAIGCGWDHEQTRD